MKMDPLRLKHFKNKEENARSAIASREVREHLAGFIRSKKLGSSCQLTSTSVESSSSQPTSTCYSNKQRSFDNHNILSLTSKSRRTALEWAQSSTDSQASQQDQSVCSFAPNPSTKQTDDDQPLRRTASMPSMHIPCKAQSLSRRKQMERRTTLSPLMKRNSRRRVVHSQANHALIDNSNYSTRSHSRSSSSPPAHHSTESYNNQQPDVTTKLLNATLQQLQHQHQNDNHDVDMLQDSLQASLYFSPKLNNQRVEVSGKESEFTVGQDIASSLNISIANSIHKTNSNPQLIDNPGNSDVEMSSEQISGNDGESITNSFNLTDRLLNKLQAHKDNTEPVNAFAYSGDDKTKLYQQLLIDQQSRSGEKQFKNAQSFLRRQQHQKVNEVIRKTVLERTSNRARNLVAGGSLDMEVGSSSSLPSHNRQLIEQFASGELRQWSLDSGDLKLTSANGKIPIPAGFKDACTTRLGTTADASIVRRSQSPNSSIMMHSKQANNPMSAVAIHSRSILTKKMASSSSSSTSSLISHQDSFEDSLSHALDLSSSSEASRHTKSKKSALGNGYHHPKHVQNPVVISNFGKQLIDFRQTLGSHDVEKLLLLRAKQNQNDNTADKQFHVSGQHPPRLSTFSNASGSLDAACSKIQRQTQIPTSNFFATLAEQFNLSNSAQNLLNSADSSVPNYSTPAMAAMHPFTATFGSPNILNGGNVAPPNVAADITSPYLYAQATAATAGPSQIGRSDLETLLLSNSAANLGQYLASTNSEAAQLDAHGQYELLKQRIVFENNSAHPSADSYRAILMSQLVNSQPNKALESRRFDLLQKSHINRTFSSPLLPTIGGAEFACQTSQQQIQAAGDVVSNCDYRNDNAAYKPSLQTFKNPLDGNGCSLDLSQDSSSSSKKSAATLPNTLNFRYNPPDSEQLSCRYILDPSFDGDSETGLTYELELCNHKCTCRDENNHPENSRRILAIWRRLYESGLMARCCLIPSRVASTKELEMCHEETYCQYFGMPPAERLRLSNFDLSKLALKGLTRLDCSGFGVDVDTAWNEELTPRVARLSAGSVIEAAMSVAFGRVKNCFAVVRPPGHHAEYQQAMGFCFFNNIAVAVKVLFEKMRISKVLIVDFDIHHGNGIQNMFYNDDKVMYISLHRHDKGNFYPGTGYAQETGAERGAGYNWNIAWHDDTMGDCEYMAAFRSFVMPVAREFEPEIVLVACGFDAARGHSANFGGYQLSPACFGWMTRQLLKLAGGKLVLCLEGGYQLKSLADCSEQCVRALLGDQPTSAESQIDEIEFARSPARTAVQVLQEISVLASKFWPQVSKHYSLIDVSAIVAEKAALGQQR